MSLWDDQEARRSFGSTAGKLSAAAHGFHNWTQEQIARVLYLRDDEAMEFEDIAIEVGIPATACRSKYCAIKDRHRAARLGDKCPSKTLLDREARERARDSQTLTASIFGDPPPGYSALDRRR